MVFYVLYYTSLHVYDLIAADGRAWDAPKPQRSGPLKANQGIETMTRSPHYRETPTDHWTESKGASHRGSVTPKRSSSMTSLQETSPEPWGGDSARSSQYSGLMDTSSIRQAVFDEWQKRKSVKLKEQMASKSAEKKKQEEKEQEERERKKVVYANSCSNSFYLSVESNLAIALVCFGIG